MCIKCMMTVLYIAAPQVIAIPPVIAAIRETSVSGGTVVGVMNQGVSSFKGIPFAAPPTGALRWRAPQPVVGWSGIKKADAFAQPCAQGSGKDFQGSEDCLYLNIWTAANSPTEKRPVMLWIHGGAFNFGGTASFDGTIFAREGIVFVSVAYRLGVLGFLAHPELSSESGKSSGAYAIQDLIAALTWVQKNIAQFGGDPSRVTIFGESAGGMAVSLLAGAPAAQGLFQQAISESGGVFIPPNQKYSGPLLSLKLAEVTGEKFLKALDAPNVDAARSIPVQQILNASNGSGMKFWFWVVLDGDVLRGANYKLYQAGRFNDTPILIGFNSDDRDTELPPAVTSKSFEAMLLEGPAACKPQAQAVLALYPRGTDAAAVRAYKDFYRDVGYGWLSWTWARLHARNARNRVFLYYFDARSPDSPDGASHGAEVPYVFGTLDATSHTEDRDVSNLMRHYWINFATRGDPNGPNLPPWPSFNEKAQSAMVFDRMTSARPLPNVDSMETVDRYLTCAPSQTGRGVD